MKILIVPSWFLPDGGMFFQEQAEILRNLGHQVTILYPEVIGLRRLARENFSVIKKLYQVEVENKEIPVYRWKFLNLSRSEETEYKQFKKGLLKLFGNYLNEVGSPDVIHAHSFVWAGVACAEILRSYKIPIVVTEHRGRFIENQYAKAHLPISFFQKKNIQRSIKDINRIITVSSELGAFFKRNGGTEANITTIYNCVDTSAFSPTVEGKSKNNFKFISVGYLTPAKGFDIVIKALAKIVDHHPNVELTIIGSGDQLKYLKDLCKFLSVQDKVYFLGHLSKNEIACQMKNHDAFILTTHVEAFGVVFIEALASGLPVIGTKSGGPQSIITEDIGYLVETDDVNDTAKAMNQIIQEKSRFSPEQISNKTKEQYSYTSIGKQIERELIKACK